MVPMPLQFGDVTVKQYLIFPQEEWNMSDVWLQDINLQQEFHMNAFILMLHSFC